MHQALQLLHRRRSIRRFTSQAIADEQIQAILAAAMAAPSARNQQPWQFVVIQERQMLDQLSQLTPYTKMLAEATLCIVVCGDTEHAFWEQDCAAATQNILLAATGLGLGSVWLGLHPRHERVQQVSSMLNIPSPYAPLCLVALGYPAESKPPADRWDASKVHYEKW